MNYRHLKDQRQIVEKRGANVMHVITKVLTAGVFQGVLNGAKMS